MSAEAPALLATLLADSLTVWKVRGEVASAGPLAAVIHAENGLVVKVESAAGAEYPIRWWVRWQTAGAAGRTKPCTSAVGLLRTVREALGVEGGNRGTDRARKRVPMISVAVLTGFLGSGKTTLLRHLLRDPAMGRTAVIINEFGEIGIDHDLIATSDERFIQLTTGCLCCNVRSDLVLTLCDLAARRAAGTVPMFDRVVIETTGLADPAPILHALMTDRNVAEIYALGNVITTVDAVHGLATLDNHAQSLRQAAVADRVVVTKTDLEQANTTVLKSRLAALNPGATQLIAVRGALPADALFDASAYDPALRLPEVERWLGRESAAAHHGTTAHTHSDHITSFCLVRETPVHAVTLALLFEALSDNCGAALLRVKGIVHVAEQPEHPAVIHGVQHVFHAPEWLERWPSNDRRTRMVFIVQEHIPPSWVRAVLGILDAEVADETARQQNN